MNNIFYKKSWVLTISVLFFGTIVIPGISANMMEQYNIQDGMVSVSAIAPDLVYSPTSHDFGNVAQGQTYQTTFQIWNGGSGTMTFNLGIVHTWISPNPTGGKSDGSWDKVTITVTIDTTGLSLGPHSGFVSITANDGGGTRYFNIDCNVVSNNPPNTPSQLSGPSSGNVGDTLIYTSSTTDPDGDNIMYGLDTNSDGIVDHWSSSYYPSGSLYTIHITFYSTGTFHLRLKAKDIHGAESGFSSAKTVVISDANSAPNTPSIPSGPSSGNIGVSYTYSTSTTDPDDDTVKYGWDWNGDGTVDEWTGFHPSGSVVSTSHTWATAGTYNVKVKAEDSNGAQSGFSSAKIVIISANNPPNKPTISGPMSGKAGKSYTYSAYTTDSDGDQVYYWFDWDDGSNSGWKGPYNSGQTVSVSHVWSAKGTYQIKVKAKDTNGAESVWSDPLPISMPKNKAIDINPLFLRFLENHPHMFPILRYILGI